MAEKVERLTYKIQFDAESGTSTIRGLDGTIKATMVSTQKLRQEYGNFATQIKATNAEINNLSGGVNGKGGLNGMSAASGSASAAALELGRVVSDAPYGIRGMANNVSQLASQLFFMASQQEIATVATKSDTVAKTTNTTATVAATTATVGFAGALRMMWTALMGPLGILLALQAVIAAADYFFGGMKKAEDSTKKLNDELSKTSSTVASSTAELEVYAKVYKEADVGTQKHTNALKELKKLGFDPATKAIDDFIIKQKELIVLQATSGVYKKQLEDLVTAKSQSDALVLKANTDMVNAQEKVMEIRKAITAAAEAEISDSAVNAISNLNTRLNSAELAYADALEKVRQLTGQRGNIWLNINDKAEEYKDTIEQILALEGGPVKGPKEPKTKKLKPEDLDIGDGVFWTTEDYNYARELEFEEQQKQLDSRSNFYAQARLDASQANNDLLNDKIEHTEQVMLLDTAESSIERFEAEKELSMLRMELSRGELDHELLIIEEKKRAQMEYVNYMYSIANILGNLAGENKKMADLALALEKGAAIAEIIVTTIASNAKIVAQGAALAIPSAGASVLAAQGLVVKNNIGAGLSIAAIIASAISSTGSQGRSVGSSASASSSGGGGSTFNPNFNIVGASGRNQLAETIAGQIGEPTRAYVVYDDIATAGEIEANAIEASGI
jgi:hypothetical protein